MLLPSAAIASANPSVDQYVESVPSVGGTPPPGTSPRSPGGAGALPPDLQRRIDASGGTDARQLEAVVTSPALGAPAPRERAEAARARGGAPAPSASEPARPAAIKAAIGAGSHGDGTPFGWLLAGWLATTAVAILAAVLRRRSRSG
jgi:hypothetical protein